MAVSRAIDDPDVVIRGFRPVYSSKLHRVYEVLLSDGNTLELVMPPPSMLKLLRSERQNIDFEAVIVQWLRTLLAAESPLSPGSARDEDEGDASSHRKDMERSTSSVTVSKQLQSEDLSSIDKSELLALLPELVTRPVTSTTLDAPYSIWRPRSGMAINSQAPDCLTKTLRAEIDIRLGELTRQFAKIQSPTTRFGHAATVLASAEPVASTKHGTRSSTPSASGSAEGSRTWSAAFNLMFEGVLRDAEDMGIMLAYSMIRKHLTRFSYMLDDVTVPSLVLVDGMEDQNALVFVVPTHTTEKETQRTSTRARPHGDERSSEEGKQREEREEGASPLCHDLEGKGGHPTPEVACEPKYQVVGLRDWSNAVFGDPLLSTAFSNNPSKELLNGFYGSKTDNHQSPNPKSEEKNDSTKTRLLLYQAYHATVAIVTEFYRPQSDSTARELAGRRKLTEALMKLEEVEDDPKHSRHRRPSGEMSPAKKLKVEEKEAPSSSRRHETTTKEA